MASAMASKDRLMLTIGNASIYLSDIVSLRPSNWLTDAVIAVFFELFQKNDERNEGHASTVALIEPSVSRLMSSIEDPDTIRSILGSDHAVFGCDLIVLPVNDVSGHGFGGTHWSTLVADVPNRRFIHHDSMLMSRNRRPAASLAKVVAQLLGWPSNAGSVQDGSCPQQTNGYDCGVAVVAVADHVWRHSDPNPASLGSVSLDHYRSELLDQMSGQVEKAYTGSP